MAITFDQPLGSNQAFGNTVTVTTTAAAAAGSRVVVCVSWFNSSGASLTVTVGGTGATVDKQINNGNDRYAVASLVVAGGLASSSSITANVANASGGVLVMACSYLGTTGVDTTGSNTGTTAAAWSTGALTCANADSLYVGGAGADGTITSESSTPTNGNERFDLFDAGDNQGAVMQDLIVSAVGSNALTGTWGTTTGLTTQTMAVVIYKGTASSTGFELGVTPAQRISSFGAMPKGA